jgi:hypothetical protein
MKVILELALRIKYFCNNVFAFFKDVIFNHKHIGLMFFMATYFFILPFIYDLRPEVMFYWGLYQFTCITFIIYLFLYWCSNLDIYLSSFLAFFGNVIILALYIIGFINLSKGLPNPVYLENLSSYSYYRYMVFLGLALVGIFFYLLIKANIMRDSITTFANYISFPYFKEEVRILIASWDISGHYCVRLTDMLIHSLTFRYVFFTLHFLIFYFFRILFLCLFINFVFFHGDLRILIYLMPISFLIWFFRFLEYYYFYFFESNKNYIKDLVLVESLTPLTSEELHSVTVTRNPSDLKFTLTDFAVKENYTLKDIDYVISQWYFITNLQVTFLEYKKIISISSKLSLVINVITWITIMIKLSKYSLVLGYGLGIGFGTLSRRAFSSSRPLLLPRDSRFMKESGMNPLKAKTKGAYSPGHPVYGEELPNGQYKVEGSLTHGKGSKEHPSHELGTRDAQGKAQRYIPHEPVTVPTGDLTPPIFGSEKTLEHPQVKEKLDKGSKNQDQS